MTQLASTTSDLQTSLSNGKIFAEQLNQFENLCSQILNDIRQNHPVAAKTLENFSRFTTFLLRNNIIPEIEVFEQLSQELTEYWHYRLTSEKNLRRSCSYIQLYQMTIMLKQNCDDKRFEYLAHTSAKKHQHNKKIIKAIKQSPGITFRELKVSCPSNTLEEQLKEFEEQFFVVSRRNGERRYYILTSLGNILYKNLYSETYNIWVDQWSGRRIFAFTILISLLQSYNNNILVQDIVNIVSLLSESQIARLIQCLVSSRNSFIRKKIKKIFQVVKHLEVVDDKISPQYLGEKFTEDYTDIDNKLSLLLYNEEFFYD